MCRNIVVIFFLVVYVNNVVVNNVSYFIRVEGSSFFLDMIFSIVGNVVVIFGKEDRY